MVAGKLVDYTLPFCLRDYVREHGLPQKSSELPQHALIGYVRDLIVSPSLGTMSRVQPDWRSAFAISSALGQAGSGALALHRHPAHSSPAPCRNWCRSRRPLPFAVPTGWSITKRWRSLRRVQAAASFITRVVERERLVLLILTLPDCTLIVLIHLI